MDKIAVLIPCYNEEKTIEKVVRDFREALPEAVIYVYNNNSKDRTAELAEKAGAVVRHEWKQGKGNVVRRMFREIQAQCYIMVDGDDTYPASAAREIADLVLNKNVDMVVGDRLSSTYFTENKRPFHNLGNKLVRFGVNHIFKGKVKDIMTGYRGFSYEFAKSFPVLSRGFEIETEMTAHALDKNMHIEEIVIQYQDRPEGSESKLNTVSDGMKVIMTIIRLCKLYRPLFFFTMISLALILLAAAVFIPLVLIPFVQTGLVDRIPTLVICGFTVLAAIVSFFSGMILDSIVQKEKREFEFRLQVLNNEKTHLSDR